MGKNNEFGQRRLESVRLQKRIRMIKKNLWIRNILACVREVASRDYQERAWLRSEVYAPCSFEEMMCGLFDDCFIREFINEKADEFGLSLEQNPPPPPLPSHQKTSHPILWVR